MGEFSGEDEELRRHRQPLDELLQKTHLECVRCVPLCQAHDPSVCNATKTVALQDP